MASKIPQPELVEQSIVVAKSVEGGHNTDLDPNTLEDNTLSLAKNCAIRDKKITRRPGTVIYNSAGASPNANKILNITDFKDLTGAFKLVRHTKSSVHYATGTNWVNVVPALALNGGDGDYIRPAIVNNRYFFSNSGIDPIQEVNFGGNTFAKASTTVPNAKKIIGFNKRLIGLNIISGQAPYNVTDPILAVWSGNENYAQFDYSVDVSAGFKRLVNSPSDLSDPITDGVGFEEFGLVVRERSIWIILTQEIATDPLVFLPRVPNVGCTCLNGVAKMKNGIAFPDLNAKEIYIYTADSQGGQSLSEIATGKVKRAFFAAIGDPSQVFSDYNPIEKELCFNVVSLTNNIVREWRFNLTTEAWTYAEHDSVSIAWNAANILGSISIDGLQGTIDNLQGTIDSLANPVATLPRRLYGRKNGDILIENENLATDDTLGNTLTNFEHQMQSKVFDIPSANVDISAAFHTITPYTTGTITEEWSRDDGNTWNTSRTFSITNSDLNKPKQIVFRKLFHTNRFMWRLRSSDCKFDLLNYELLGMPGGLQK